MEWGIVMTAGTLWAMLALLMIAVRMDESRVICVQTLPDPEPKITRAPAPPRHRAEPEWKRAA